MSSVAEDKESVGRRPADPAAKAADMSRPSQGQNPQPQPQPQLAHLRVARTQTVGLSVSSQTAVSTYSQTMLKQVSVSRGTLPMPSPVGSPLTIRSPLVAQTTVSTATHVSTTYHVPRGAAAVANIAAPRSAVATPIVRAAAPTLQTTGVSVTPSFSPGLRCLGPAPLLPRASSPAPAAAWLAASPPLAIAKCSSPGPALAAMRPQTIAAVPAYTQGRPAAAAAAARSVTGQGSGRLQAESPRPTLVHSATQKPVVSTQVGQLHFAEKMFKSSVSVAQVVPQGPPPRPSAAARIAVGASHRPGVPAPGRARLGLVSAQPAPAAQARFAVAAGPKVMAQPSHAASIQITQVPVSSGKAAQSLQQTITRSISYAGVTTTSAAGSVAGIRPIAVASSPGIPVAKVFPTAVGACRPAAPAVSEVSLPAAAPQAPPQATSVYIQTSHRASPAPSGQAATSTYSLPTTYYYETPSGYQLARPFQPVPTTAPAAPAAPAVPAAAVQLPRLTAPSIGGVVSATQAQSVKFSPVMVVESSRTPLPVHSSFVTEGVLAVAEAQPLPVPASVPTPVTQANPSSPVVSKLTASPRPSILRKRENDGSPLKAQKNLVPVLAALSAPPASPPSPRRPDSRGNGGNSSGGSTTISATSSPGLNEAGDDSMPAAPAKPEPPVEMSPRKKPRKQQLTRNELPDTKFSDDEMEFLPEQKTKDVKEAVHAASEEKACAPPKRPQISLINSYRHTWKSRHNHFLRYGDVKPKDERRPTVADLAGQRHVLQKLGGWKIYHLSTQMEELAELESHVVEKLSAILKVMEKKTEKEVEKDVNRLNELIKGNMQRSKIIKDQMQEAEIQVKKIVDHKDHVTDIISKCANKRYVKKREKM
ncbi:histone deacetylase complex subunit SAP130-like [Bacillus rossius redtenbacheri]|uniref:histone deacetylase complex subunit SAP130-like n=1 Tax=Bacillus rossius redtenbacheri TaxID=93214 RepID=UPI002FDDCD19